MNNSNCSKPKATNIDLIERKIVFVENVVGESVVLLGATPLHKFLATSKCRSLDMSFSGPLHPPSSASPQPIHGTTHGQG